MDVSISDKLTKGSQITKLLGDLDQRVSEDDFWATKETVIEYTDDGYKRQILAEPTCENRTAQYAMGYIRRNAEDFIARDQLTIGELLKGSS